MKNTKLLASFAGLAACAVLLSGCEIAIKNPGKTESTASAAVTVADTTLSAKDSKISNSFYSKSGKTSNGISGNRYNQGQGSSSTTKAPSGSTTAKAAATKTDSEIIAGKKYIITGRMVQNGVVSDYRVASNNGKYAVYCTYNKVPIGVIMNGDYLYILLTAKKEYVKISKAELKKQAGDDKDVESLLNGSVFTSTDDKKVVSSGKKTISGKSFNYRKYDDGSTDYYSGTSIVMTRLADGTTIYYDSISETVKDAVFSPPSNYVNKPMDMDMLSELAEIMGDETTTTKK